jgi:hypothetical protein
VEDVFILLKSLASCANRRLENSIIEGGAYRVDNAVMNDSYSDPRP